MRRPLPVRLPQVRFARLRARWRIARREALDRAIGAGWGLLVVAALIGAATGYAVMLFYGLIDLIHALLSAPAAAWPAAARALYPALTVTAGLYATQALVGRLAPGPRLQPLPAVMLAAAKRAGDLPQRGIWARTVGAAITLGCGGSTGSEGPVVAVGAALGSGSGRFLRLRPNLRKVMLGCGAAAGISAAFNAPIAGVMFALEEVVGTFSVAAFSPVVVASVMAAVVARSRLGDHPAFGIPEEFALVHASEIVLYLGLAFAAAVFAVAYTRGLYACEDGLRRIPKWWRPAVAGCAVGLLALLFPEVLGPGRREIQAILFGQLAGFGLAALALAKIAATGLTLGGGGAGGYFTPALYVGAAMGHAYGAFAERLLPEMGTEVTAFALVGMGAVLAGATHAPISAIIIIFEMTGDYGLILPLMLACVLSYLIARRLYPQSVYTEALRRAGEHIAHGVDQSVFARVRVGDWYDPRPTAVREDTPVRAIVEQVRRGRPVDLPVVDGSGALVGVIPYQSLLRAAQQPEAMDLLLAHDLATEVAPVTPGDPLVDAMRRLAARDLEALPVVDARDGNRLLGVITRARIWQAYDSEILRAG